MTKRDALLSLLEPGYRQESVPAAFFLHFDPAFHRGRAAIDKHLEFFRFTGMDMVKIQFEHHMPAMEIKKPKDWARVPVRRKAFWEEPLAVVKGLVEAAGREAVVILTLYSPFMFAGHVAGQDTVVRHIQEDPEAFKKGINAITESIMLLVRECARLGLDGFYTSTQGRESGRLADPRAFDECIRPFDLRVMTEVNQICRFNILHVCDYHLPYADISPFTGYPGHIVSTGLKLTDREISAKEVAGMFNRPFMGGLERKGVLATGPEDAVRGAARRALEDAPERFILAADCTVPAETPWENLRAAIQAAHEFRR